MLDKQLTNEFNSIFPRDIRDQFLFPLSTYRLFLEKLSINPQLFFNKWSHNNLCVSPFRGPP